MSVGVSLRRLAQSFDQANHRFPKLHHILFEKPDGGDGRGLHQATLIGREAHPDCVRLIEYEHPGPVQAHLFYGYASEKGAEGFTTFCVLARLAVTFLTEAGKLSSEVEPDESWPVVVQNHWSRRLMCFVHALAQATKPGAILKAFICHSMNGRSLPDGVVGSELAFGIFEAAAMALEMTAEELEEGAERAKPVRSILRETESSLVADRIPSVLPTLLPSEVRGDQWQVLRDLYESVGEYLRYLDFFRTYQSPWADIARYEVLFVQAVRRILACISAIEAAREENDGELLGLHKERKLNQIKRILATQIARWKLEKYLEPVTGDALIKSMLTDRKNTKKLPFLRATLTWRLQEDAEDNPLADHFADEARCLGLQPLRIPPPEAKKLSEYLHRRWCSDPLLGETCPSATPQERNEVESTLLEMQYWFPAPSATSPHPGIDESLGNAPVGSKEGMKQASAQNHAGFTTKPGIPQTDDAVLDDIRIPGEQALKPEGPSMGVADPEKQNETVVVPETESQLDSQLSQCTDTTEDEHDECNRLTVSQKNILIAMIELSALDEDSRKSQAEISEVAGVGMYVGNSQNCFGELKRRGFLLSQTGRKGGSWLTESGKAIATQLKTQGGV